MADETTSYNADDFDKGFAAYEAGDYVEAVKWCRKAAEQGNMYAQNGLALMYNNSTGVTQDYAEAAKWYRKAANQGDADAQNNLGLMYGRGKGVTQDTIAALLWFNAAVTNGNTKVAKDRDDLAKKLTGDQLEKVTERVKRCMGSNYKDCDAKAKSWWQKLTD